MNTYRRNSQPSGIPVKGVAPGFVVYPTDSEYKTGQKAFEWASMYARGPGDAEDPSDYPMHMRLLWLNRAEQLSMMFPGAGYGEDEPGSDADKMVRSLRLFRGEIDSWAKARRTSPTYQEMEDFRYDVLSKLPSKPGYAGYSDEEIERGVNSLSKDSHFDAFVKRWLPSVWDGKSLSKEDPLMFRRRRNPATRHRRRNPTGWQYLIEVPSFAKASDKTLRAAGYGTRSRNLYMVLRRLAGGEQNRLTENRFHQETAGISKTVVFFATKLHANRSRKRIIAALSDTATVATIGPLTPVDNYIPKGPPTYEINIEDEDADYIMRDDWSEQDERSLRHRFPRRQRKRNPLVAATHYRRNTDEELRRLEREALSGDSEAIERLERHRARLRPLGPLIKYEPFDCEYSIDPERSDYENANRVFHQLVECTTYGPASQRVWALQRISDMAVLFEGTEVAADRLEEVRVTGNMVYQMIKGIMGFPSADNGLLMATGIAPEQLETFFSTRQSRGRELLLTLIYGMLSITGETNPEIDDRIRERLAEVEEHSLLYGEINLEPLRILKTEIALAGGDPNFESWLKENIPSISAFLQEGEYGPSQLDQDEPDVLYFPE